MAKFRVFRDFLKLIPGVDYLYHRIKAPLVGASNNYFEQGNDLNPEKFYVIWRSGGGFFSIISTVLAHLKISEAEQLHPIIDLQNFPTHYQEAFPVHGSTNVWEYYFKAIGTPMDPHTYLQKHYKISSGGHPEGASMSIASDPDLLGVWERHVTLNPEVSSSIEYFVENLQISDRTLGVHFRGKEMRTAPGHPLPPTFKQICRHIDASLVSLNFDQVYLLTEGKDYLRRFKRRYGDRLVYTDSFRTTFRNAYNFYPRSKHKYLLGFEVLRDTILLSRCGGIISGSSNVSEMAILLSNNKYKINVQIRNGTNSSNAFKSIFSWYLLVPKLNRQMKQKNEFK